MPSSRMLPLRVRWRSSRGERSDAATEARPCYEMVYQQMAYENAINALLDPAPIPLAYSSTCMHGYPHRKLLTVINL